MHFSDFQICSDPIWQCTSFQRISENQSPENKLYFQSSIDCIEMRAAISSVASIEMRAAISSSCFFVERLFSEYLIVWSSCFFLILVTNTLSKQVYFFQASASSEQLLFHKRNFLSRENSRKESLFCDSFV